MTPNSDMRLPHFVIIGAGKCGTTAIWKELKTHPALCGSRIKETDFFSHQFEFKDIEWYQSQFEEPNKIYYEASPDYTSVWNSHRVPARMYNLIPDAKLVFMIRHPVKRTTSRVLHRVGKSQVHFNRLDNIRFWKRDPNAREAIAGSQFEQRLTPFLEYYDKDKILILKHEDLKANPAETYNRILRFVGVQQDLYTEDHPYIHANVTAEKRRPLFKKVHRRLRVLSREGKLPAIYKLLEKRIVAPQWKPEILDYIWTQVSTNLKEFEEMIDRDLNYTPYWRE